MSDNLTIIKRIIDEHQTIRGHVKLVGDSIADQEALMSLTRTRADWVPGQPDIAEKQERLQQTISFLDEGLKNHFAFEEKAFPQLLGELFARALELEHDEIRGEIDEAKSILANTRLEGLSREELISKQSGIREIIDSICQLVEEHAGKEEKILEMLQKALDSYHCQSSGNS